MPTHPIPTIGLLGAPGSGKSLVANQLMSLGCTVIDADALAKQVLESGDVKENIVSWWGGDYITESGRVDRRKVARLVFDHPDERERLEALIHPRVHERRAELKVKALQTPDIVAIVEDCPLLIETGIDEECDTLIFVDAPFETRLERVQRTRGWDREELARRDNNQTPLDIKRQRADYVISNDADEAQCLAQTRRVLSQIIQRHLT